MNKPILLVSLLLGSSGQAQIWTPPGATWYYESGFPDQNGYFRVVYESDTVLDGRIAQKMISELFWFSIPLQQYTSLPSVEANFTTVEDDVVYIWNYQEWDTLFWSGAVPGDSWVLTTEGEVICESVFLVTDTGFVDHEGQHLRSIEIAPQTDQPWISQITVLERIGTLEVVWFTMFYCGAATILPLRCYSDNEMTYETGIAPACDFILGTSEAFPGRSLSVYPNPGGNRIFFSGPHQQRPSRVTILDMSGRIMFVSFVSAAEPSIDTNQLPSGPYIIRVTDDEGFVSSLFWIKV